MKKTIFIFLLFASAVLNAQVQPVGDMPFLTKARGATINGMNILTELYLPSKDTANWTPLRCGALTALPSDVAAKVYPLPIYIWCKFWSRLGAGDVSQPVCVAPTITAQPSSQTVQEGQNLTLSVAASGTAPFSYQWRKDGNNINSAIAINYNKSGVTNSDAGLYSVLVSNACGSATSSAASVSISTAPITIYAGRWGWQASDPSANMAAASFQNSASFTIGQSASLSLSGMPDETYFYFEMPASQPYFSTYSNDLAVNQDMPDANFKFIEQAGKRYIVTRGPISFTSSMPLIFKY